jgi:hypothetical protein
MAECRKDYIEIKKVGPFQPCLFTNTTYMGGLPNPPPEGVLKGGSV